MKNTNNAKREEEPVIDPELNDHINALHDIDEALFAAHYRYQETHSVTQRKTAYTAFAQAVYELEGVLAYLQSYQKRLRNGVEASTPGKIIPLRRRQPRDARGRFAKRTALRPESTPQEPCP